MNKKIMLMLAACLPAVSSAADNPEIKILATYYIEWLRWRDESLIKKHENHNKKAPLAGLFL